MELGEKLKTARLEAGMTQKALCGEEITRNMLSLIENGSAQPSMKTLRYLANRLGKPVGYFLEEELPLSGNLPCIRDARRCFDGGEWQQALNILARYQGPDSVFDREKDLMVCICCLNLAQEALDDGRIPHARHLLETAPVNTAYCSRELNRRYLLLLGRLPNEFVSRKLPPLDEELFLRAWEEWRSRGNLSRAEILLEAMEERDARWHLLRGYLCYEKKDYSEASLRLRSAEADYPKEAFPMLEVCFRELGNFEKAYEYACRVRDLK